MPMNYNCELQALNYEIEFFRKNILKYTQPKLVLGAKLRFGCYMPTVFTFKNPKTNLLSV